VLVPEDQGMKVQLDFVKYDGAIAPGRYGF